MLVLALGWGCSGGPDLTTSAPASGADVAKARVADSAYLLSPLRGYPLAASPDDATALEGAFRDLLERGDSSQALATAQTVESRSPTLHAARVLRAQALLVAGRALEARDLLAPVVVELPEYSAARLAYARSAELSQDLVAAYDSYRFLATASPPGAGSEVAADRADVVRTRALEILANRLQDALQRGHHDAAEKDLGRLEAWDPDSWTTLEAARQVAVARQDGAAELKALRRLVQLAPEEKALRQRHGELEAEVGDAGTGVNILRGLVAQEPGNGELTESLAKAEFRWRVSLLPREVQKLLRQPHLARADVAVLLYWLVPGIRYGRGQQGRIATDILDHPQREAIARVINFGLMDLDETLHHFSPTKEANRSQILTGILRYLDGQPRRAACLGPAALPRSLSYDSLCSRAAECRLLASAGDCLPRAPLSGAEALELVRRGLRWVGGP